MNKINIWSVAGILEKNKLANDKPFLLLLEIEKDGLEVIRLVRDNQDCIWNNNIFQCFPFEFDNIKEDGKTLPGLNLKVCNTNGLIQSYVQKESGFCDAKVKIMVVHAAHLENIFPELTMDFVIQSTKYDENWITFVLGAANDYKYRYPVWKYMNNICPYKFKDIQCGYSGEAVECDNTLIKCRIPLRFGGEPGMTTR